MLKRLLIVTTLGLLVTLPAVGSDREDDLKRTDKSAQVFREIMKTPDHGIRLHIWRQLRQGVGNLSHRARLERPHVCGD